MTFQQNDLFKNNNSFGEVSQRFVFPRVAATDFIVEIDGSFPVKAPLDLSHLSQVNFLFKLKMISYGNRTECSPIRSVIIRVITKSDDHEAGVRLVYHEYDYRPNWMTRSPIAN